MDAERVSFCMSQKGKEKAVYRGFFFEKNKQKETKNFGIRVYWKCVRRRDNRCEVRITTTLDGEDLLTSNNYAEAWHRRLNSVIVTDHPSFYTALHKASVGN